MSRDAEIELRETLLHGHRVAYRSAGRTEPARMAPEQWRELLRR